MIGSEEMSSTSMDITETFRPEDLSKTDFFDFVTAPDMGIGIGVNDRPPGSNETNGTTDQPLQGYDQFWGSDKYPNRLDSAIFEDLDRYCWQQQQQQTQQQQQQPQQPQQQQQQQTQQSQQHQTTSNSSNGGTTLNQSSSIVGGLGNTDGQIYTLTVLNGTEPWIKRDPDAPIAPTLDLDSLLGSFPGYVKSEFVYEDSGFGTDGTKDDINQPAQHQQTQPSQGTGSVLPTRSIVTSNSTNLSQFQNNNNDWHMADHNATEQNSAESLLRSALQGKGYSKGVHIQNGFTIIPAANLVKDEELRRALFSTDQDSLAFADSTLSAPTIFDETQGIVGSPTTQQPQTPQPSNTASTTNNGSNHSTATNQSTTTAGIIVDDMFLSLETAFSDDFERIKRIASEVQQFCTSTDYPEVIMEVTAGIPQTQTLQVQQATPQPQPPPPQPLQQEVTTSNPTPTSTVTKTTAKKYKRSISNNNNNNSTNNNNLNTNNNNNSPTQCNGQRKERSLHYCSICSKGFKDKYSVNVHIRTHTGEKPFACSLCGKSFRQKAHLAKHYQTHLAQKNGNVVKGGKQSQGQNRQSQSQSQQQPQPPPQSTTVQRQNSTSSNNSNPATLPPANGLMAGR